MRLFRRESIEPTEILKISILVISYRERVTSRAGTALRQWDNEIVFCETIQVFFKMMQAILLQGCFLCKVSTPRNLSIKIYKILKGCRTQFAHSPVWLKHSKLFSFSLAQQGVSVLLSCHQGRLSASRRSFLCWKKSQAASLVRVGVDGGGDDTPLAGIPPFLFASAFSAWLPVTSSLPSFR